MALRKEHQWILFAAIFLDLTGFGMAFPDIQIRAEKFGAPGWMIGAILATLFIIQTLVSPRWGVLSDRIGRKPVIIACTFLSGMSMVVYALATNLWIMWASRILGGLAAANVVVAQSYVADSTDEESRTKVLGHLGAALQTGLIIGPAFGGYLAHEGANKLLGFTAAGSSFIAVLLLTFLPPEPKRERIVDAESKRKRNALFDFSLLKDIPQLRTLFTLAVVSWFSLACLEGTFGRLLEKLFHMGQREFGVIFSFESIIAVLVQAFLIERLRKKLGDTATLRLGYALAGFGLLLTPFAPSYGIIFIFSGSYSLGTSLANPTVNGLCSKLAPENRQGELFGLLQGSRSIGFIIGPLIGGFLFDWHKEAPYIFAGAVGLVAAISAGPLLRGLKPSRQHVAESLS